MGQLINVANELIRISSAIATKIEVSKNNGRSWSTRYSSASCGDFQDLTFNGKELLAQTSKGIYVSKNQGRSWSKRG